MYTATMHDYIAYYITVITFEIKHWNNFKIISATLNMLETIHELQKASEKISK